MNVEVLLFAGAREVAGRSMLTIAVAETTTVAELREHIVAAAPELASLEDSLLLAINNRYATPEQPIEATDEIACFPPVSGG